MPSGTIVSTENGAEEIQNIEIGEKVWSYNVKAKKWELKPVEVTFIHDYAGDVVDFEVNGNPVEASGNHGVGKKGRGQAAILDSLGLAAANNELSV